MLIADDARVNRMLLMRALSKTLPGAQFTEATSGEYALELLRTQVFDVAFLDEYYGQTEADALTGTDVTRSWRRIEQSAHSQQPHKARGRLVIIGVTGNKGDGAFDSHALAAGQDLVWSKPLPSPAEMGTQLQLLGVTQAT